VSAGKGVRIWDELKGGIVLGREDFVEEIARRERLVHRPSPDFSQVRRRGAIVRSGFTGR